MPVPSIITSAKAAAKAYRLRVSIESIKQGIEASRLRPGDGSGDAALERGLRHRRAHVQERVLRHRHGPALRHGVALRADGARRRPDAARRAAHPYPGEGHPAVRRAIARRQALQAHHRQPGDLPGGEPLRGETAHGRVTLTAEYSAEAIVGGGGAYINTITHAYLRIAGWIDCMAWGGWVEADAIRCESIRSVDSIAASVVIHCSRSVLPPVRKPR